MKWTWCVACVAMMIALAPSAAFGQAGGLSPKLADGKIVVTTSEALDEQCWEPLDRDPKVQSKRYALRSAKEKCIDRLKLPDLGPVKVESGNYTIRGAQTTVSLVLD